MCPTFAATHPKPDSSVSQTVELRRRGHTQGGAPRMSRRRQPPPGATGPQIRAPPSPSVLSHLEGKAAASGSARTCPKAPGVRPSAPLTTPHPCPSVPSSGLMPAPPPTGPPTGSFQGWGCGKGEDHRGSPRAVSPTARGRAEPRSPGRAGGVEAAPGRGDEPGRPPEPTSRRHPRGPECSSLSPPPQLLSATPPPIQARGAAA